MRMVYADQQKSLTRAHLGQVLKVHTTLFSVCDAGEGGGFTQMPYAALRRALRGLRGWIL